MTKTVIALMTGLIGAAVLHIMIILVLPLYTGSDAWSKVINLGPENEFHVLANQENSTGLYNEDIHIQSAVCYYDLDDGPLQISTDNSTDMWTFGTFDADTNEVFSMSARSSIGGEVNFLIVTRAQILTLRSEEPDLVSRTIAIEVADTQGYAVLRAIAPDFSQVTEARSFLSSASCALL